MARRKGVHQNSLCTVSQSLSKKPESTKILLPAHCAALCLHLFLNLSAEPKTKTLSCPSGLWSRSPVNAQQGTNLGCAEQKRDRDRETETETESHRDRETDRERECERETK